MKTSYTEGEVTGLINGTDVCWAPRLSPDGHRTDAACPIPHRSRRARSTCIACKPMVAVGPSGGWRALAGLDAPFQSEHLLALASDLG